MKSRTVDATLFSKIAKTLRAVKEDNLSLYAAQSSFYICISAIPFIMLVILIVRLVAPGFTDDILSIARSALPEASHGVFDTIIEDVTTGSAVSSISIAAIGLLWASARGLSAVVRGVSRVYGREVGGSYVVRSLRSVVYTAGFIVVMIVTLAVLVFGKYFKDAMTSEIGEVPMFVRYKEAIAFFVLTLFFSLLYFLVGAGAFSAQGFKWDLRARAKFSSGLPGAAISALGWIVFSLAYSLYFEYFPRFSYLYGSLAAIVFLMLWVYFCILILLIGAEINKMIIIKKEKVGK